MLNVRFGSGADICSAPTHVRFTPNSDRESGLTQTVMSALPPKADMCGATRRVCFGPEADIVPIQKGQFTAAGVLRRTSAMIAATSFAIFGPCVLISENSASEIRSRSPDLKLGHSRA